MISRREYRMVLMISAGAALLTLLPYLLAAKVTPPGIGFSGFIVNPVDGYSYLAKMRQGAEGSWIFTLPYAADPGPGAFLYAYHLLLGHLSTWLNLPLLSIYHAARVIAAFLLYLTAYRFLRWVIAERDLVWFTWLAVILGSGLGWVSILLLDHPASDMLIPESIPSLSAMVNAHFPLTLWGMLLAVLAVVNPEIPRLRRLIIAVVSGTVLGIVLPFAAVSLVVVLMVWELIEWILQVKSGWDKPRREWVLNHLLPLVIFALALLPWFIYDGWLSASHPVLRLWNVQNQTPSPPVWDYMLGFGVVLFLACFGLRVKRIRSQPGWRFLATWSVLGSLMIYAPVAFQRRMSMGLFFAFVALASAGVVWLEAHGLRRKTIILFALALMLPSNALLIGASLVSISGGDPDFVHTQGELGAYRWLDAHISPGDLILASETIGNRLPAFTSARVLYGHPFETPQADLARQTIRTLFQNSNGDSGLKELKSLGVDYVFYGWRERQLGEPGWLPLLDPVVDFEEVQIYAVPGS